MKVHFQSVHDVLQALCEGVLSREEARSMLAIPTRSETATKESDTEESLRFYGAFHGPTVKLDVLKEGDVLTYYDGDRLAGEGYYFGVLAGGRRWRFGGRDKDGRVEWERVKC